MEVEILDAKNSESFGKCSVQADTTIKELKKEVQKLKPSIPVHCQALQSEPRGKTLNDSDTLQSLGISTGGKIYVKDLGPQITWKGVYLAEYAGSIFVYLIFYLRSSFIYGSAATNPVSLTANIAAACWVAHYVKRLLETLFVHRFSKATMPLWVLFKNCTYYWGSAGYVSYSVNHPDFTGPKTAVLYIGLVLFIVSELGNFSIHMLLRNVIPAGSKDCKIPEPNANRFTLLFKFVSCPKYTYEVISWVSFWVMTTCVPALIFAAVGMYQMTVWAIGKHNKYQKEFKEYPKCRKAIFPFVL